MPFGPWCAQLLHSPSSVCLWCMWRTLLCHLQPATTDPIVFLARARTHTHTHARTHARRRARTPHTHTHTHEHTHARAHTRKTGIYQTPLKYFLCKAKTVTGNQIVKEWQAMTFNELYFLPSLSDISLPPCLTFPSASACRRSPCACCTPSTRNPDGRGSWPPPDSTTPGPARRRRHV